MQKQKYAPHAQPNKYKFIIGWVLAWVAASSLPDFISNHILPLDFLPNIFLYFALLSTFQFFWVRRYLRINLRHWAPLALLGLIVVFVANPIIAAAIGYPVPAGLWDPTSILVSAIDLETQLSFALYHTASWMLLWFAPPLFQWLALRKRFRLHGLWLLATLVAALFSYFLSQHGGIFTQALLPSISQTGYLPYSDLQFLLASITMMLDFAIPPAIMGFVLYYLIHESRTEQAPTT